MHHGSSGGALRLPAGAGGTLATKGTFREPAAIEAACARILTAREIRGTLSEIRRTGASATYHALDVRDADALRALIG